MSDAARNEAERRWPGVGRRQQVPDSDRRRRGWFIAGAEWAEQHHRDEAHKNEQLHERNDILAAANQQLAARIHKLTGYLNSIPAESTPDEHIIRDILTPATRHTRPTDART